MLPKVLRIATATPRLDWTILMIQYVIMIRVNVHDAKTNLSRYLARVAAGETVLICNRNVPVAEMRPIPRRRRTKRPIGLARGVLEVPASFFEPLPDAETDAWEGKGR